MAARVVYLVRHRAGAPRRGARPDLHHQGGQRAAQPDPQAAPSDAGALRGRGRATTARTSSSRPWRPTTPTPPSLLTDHGLRIGHEPDTRVVTDAARYQLGARVVDRYTGEVAPLTDHPETAIQNLLALDSAMSEHLVGPDDVRAPRRRGAAGFVAGARGGAGRQQPQDLRRGDRQGDLRDRPPRRAARAGRGLPPAQGRPRADGLLRPDRARRPAGQRPARGRGAGARRGSGWSCSTSTRTPRWPRR